MTLSIILRLRIPEFAIQTTSRHQLIVTALFYNLAIIKNNYVITESAARHSMTYVNRSLIFYHVVKVLVDFKLSNRVQRRSWLIKNYKRSILVKCTRNCKLLCFTAGNLNAVFIVILIEV